MVISLILNIFSRHLSVRRLISGTTLTSSPEPLKFMRRKRWRGPTSVDTRTRNDRVEDTSGLVSFVLVGRRMFPVTLCIRDSETKEEGRGIKRVDLRRKEDISVYGLYYRQRKETRTRDGDTSINRPWVGSYGTGSNWLWVWTELTLHPYLRYYVPPVSDNLRSSKSSTP